jgi:hypothetical protein
VENTAALSMYEKMGYQIVDSTDPMYLEFTTKLNLHDGATKGRKHHLMYKNLVSCPVWLQDPVEEQQQQRSLQPTDYHRPSMGTLGFEVPC